MVSHLRMSSLISISPQFDYQPDSVSSVVGLLGSFANQRLMIGAYLCNIVHLEFYLDEFHTVVK
jgi:hypothetical protein